MGDFKLFVVGESSGNPDDWSEWGDRAFVIARSKEEALSLADMCGHAVAEIPRDKAVLLHYEPLASDRL
jgi:hypothetical protein